MKNKRTYLYWTLSAWIGFSVVTFTGYGINTWQWWVVVVPFILILAALILTDKEIK